MDSFDTIQNVLWGGAQEAASEIYDPDEYPDEWEDLAEQIWFELCEEKGVDPYA